MHDSKLHPLRLESQPRQNRVTTPDVENHAFAPLPPPRHDIYSHNIFDATPNKHTQLTICHCLSVQLALCAAGGMNNCLW